MPTIVETATASVSQDLSLAALELGKALENHGFKDFTIEAAHGTLEIIVRSLSNFPRQPNWRPAYGGFAVRHEYTLVTKDIHEISPTTLRDVEEKRLSYIAALELENATLHAQIATLHARLTAHDQAIARVRELGDTPWVAAAREKKAEL